jgi:hypothetical protein
MTNPILIRCANNQRVLSPWLPSIMQMHRNWSDSQFLVCFGQLTRDRHLAVAEDFEQITKGAAHAVGRFVDDNCSVLRRD